MSLNVLAEAFFGGCVLDQEADCVSEVIALPGTCHGAALVRRVAIFDSV